MVDSHIPVEDDGNEEYENENDGDIDVNMDDILDEPPASPELEAKAGDEHSRSGHFSSYKYYAQKSQSCFNQHG